MSESLIYLTALSNVGLTSLSSALFNAVFFVAIDFVDSSHASSNILS